MAFYDNREMMKTTLLSVLKKGQNTKYVMTLKEVFSNVKIKDMVDETCIELTKMIKKAIEGIGDSILRSEMLFEYAKSSDEDLNEEIHSRMDEPLGESVMHDLMAHYATIKLYPILIDKSEEIIDAVTKINIGGIKDSADAMENLRELLGNVQTEINKSLSVEDGKTIEFEEDTIIGFDETIKEMRDTETFRVYTDTALDDHDGGYAPTKSYCKIGIPGGGKSLTLLNTALLIRHANKFTPMELEGYKPIVIYITLENTTVQTFERMLAFYGMDSDEIDAMSPAELKAKCMELVSPKDEFDIRFSIKQFKRYTIDGVHLTNMVKDYENRGYKVMALVVDYLDLLEFHEDAEDRYNSKMPIVKKAEDLKNTAIDGFTPVITAAQTNRNGEVAIKEAIERGKNVIDPIKALHGGCIAGGYQLKGEFDFVSFIYKGEFNGKNYVSIMSDKERDHVEKNEDRKYQSGKKLSVVPLNGFRYTKETLHSASELFPEDKTTVNILSEGNRKFKDMVEEGKGKIETSSNKKKKENDDEKSKGMKRSIEQS